MHINFHTNTVHEMYINFHSIISINNTLPLLIEMPTKSINKYTTILTSAIAVLSPTVRSPTSSVDSPTFVHVLMSVRQRHILHVRHA